VAFYKLIFLDFLMIKFYLITHKGSPYNFVNWSADEQAGGPKQWFCLDNAAEARAILSKHANAAPVVITGHRHIGLNYKELDEKITLLPFIIF
jgi:hypothetical protein